MIHSFEGFKLIYNEVLGRVSTVYEDRAVCTVDLNKDHEYHAKILGITPVQFNLLHEVSHHVVGIIYGQKGCPIIWATAHRKPLPDNAGDLEWKITAISYFAMQRPMRHSHEWSAIGELSKLTNVWDAGELIRTIYHNEASKH